MQLEIPFLVSPRVSDKRSTTSIHGYDAPQQQQTNFERSLSHFITFVKCSPDKKALPILDNHCSHISPKGLDIYKRNGIVLLTIPPHTSHELQPLDVAVYFNEACDDFSVQNPGQAITLKYIAKLVGNAYQRAFIPLNIIREFSKKGIYPFDSHLFTDHAYLTSKVTDRSDPSQREETPEATTAPFRDEQLTPEPIPGTFDETRAPGPFYVYKSPEERRALPQAPPRKQKPAKTKFLTDTPNEERKNEPKKHQNRRPLVLERTSTETLQVT